jgi:exosortase family protein XrtG
MSWSLLQLLLVIYIVGLALIQRWQWGLTFYLWGAFGFTFLFVHLSLLQGWNVVLSSIEAEHSRLIAALIGIQIQAVNQVILLIPEATGWTGLNIGIECSTLIEVAVFMGLMLFYPRLTLQQRSTYFVLGLLGTYLLNLLRIMVIVVMVVIWGKSAVPFAHAVVARLIYFIGVVMLYWFLFTRPTLLIIRRGIEASGHGVD